MLQDELGDMQDAEVASLQLADLATGDAHLPAATIFMMGGVAEQHRREVKRLLKRLPDELPRHRAGGPGASCAISWSAGGQRRRRPGRPSAPRCRAAAPTARAENDRPDRRVPAPASHPEPVHPARRPGLTSLRPPARSQAKGNEPASSPMTTRGCSVTMKCSLSVSRKFPMSVQMSGKSGSAMWAR